MKTQQQSNGLQDLIELIRKRAKNLREVFLGTSSKENNPEEGKKKGLLHPGSPTVIVNIKNGKLGRCIIHLVSR